ncbi:MAG: DUF3560 domain-containing protein [Raineya sp.]|jgi:hypothetical protein|nr:DUF3560 domain-containing protein [Raineya sp.]
MSKSRFSSIFELPIQNIHTNKKLFQNRSEDFSKATFDKIINEGFDKSRDPIEVWFDGNKYIVISGHSRFAAAQNLYNAGQEDLSTLPVKQFLGDLDDAIAYATLESNRSGTAEGLLSDVRAFKKALKSGCNKDCLKGLFKTESYISSLQRLSYLDEEGEFLKTLNNPGEAKNFTNLQRYSEWMGELRKFYEDKLTNKHEREIFDFLFIESGKLFKKEEFFNLIEKAVNHITFDSSKPLNLKNYHSKSVYQIYAETELEQIEKDIEELKSLLDVKRKLLARTEKQDRRNEIEAEITGLNRNIVKKIEDLDRIKQNAKEADKMQLDLFASPSVEVSSKENTEEKVSSEENKEEKISSNEKPKKEPWELTWKDYNEEYYDFSKVRDDLIKKFDEDIKNKPKNVTNEDFRKEWWSIYNPHKKAVKDALEKGKDVPQEVLAEYPELINNPITEEKEEEKTMEPENKNNRVYKINSDGKAELYFDYNDYKSLSNDDKKKIKSYFLFSRPKGAWISKGKFYGSYMVEKIVKELGFSLEGKDERKTYEEKIEQKLGNAEKRADRFEAKSAKSEKKAESLQAEFNKYRKDWSWLTQPFVNTSGGRAFQKSKDRVMNKYEKGFEEYKKSEYYQDRAETSKHYAKDLQRQFEDKDYLMRKIKEATKSIEKWDTWLPGYIEKAETMEEGDPRKLKIELAFDEYKETVQRKAFLVAKLEELKEKGVRFFDKENMKGATYINAKGNGDRWFKVYRLNPTTVTHSWFVGDWKSLYSEILDFVTDDDDYTVIPKSYTNSGKPYDFQIIKNEKTEEKPEKQEKFDSVEKPSIAQRIADLKVILELDETDEKIKQRIADLELINSL